MVISRRGSTLRKLLMEGARSAPSTPLTSARRRRSRGKETRLRGVGRDDETPEVHLRRWYRSVKASSDDAFHAKKSTLVFRCQIPKHLGCSPHHSY